MSAKSIGYSVPAAHDLNNELKRATTRIGTLEALIHGLSKDISDHDKKINMLEETIRKLEEKKKEEGERGRMGEEEEETRKMLKESMKKKPPPLPPRSRRTVKRNSPSSPSRSISVKPEKGVISRISRL